MGSPTSDQQSRFKVKRMGSGQGVKKKIITGKVEPRGRNAEGNGSLNPFAELDDGFGMVLTIWIKSRGERRARGKKREVPSADRNRLEECGIGA